MKLLSKSKSKRWEIVDKMFISLFLTGVLMEFSDVGAGFIDGLIISRNLGAEAMAAEGIIHPIFSIRGVISGLLAVGMQTRCAKAIGRGDREEFKRFVSATAYVSVIVALIYATIIIVFAEPIAVLLGASGKASELVGPASAYLRALGIGAPACIMTAILSPALQLDTGRKVIRIGAIIEGVSNIILDIVAVKAGWGIFGVGLATAFASYLNLLYQCTFFLKKDRILHFVKPDVSFGEFMKMLSSGSERAVRRLANTLRPIILNTIIISYGGTMAMSALSVRNNFSNFAELFGAGIAAAVALLTGVYYGEMNEEAIEEVNKQEHRMIAVFPLAMCVLMVLLAKPIASLYIDGEGEVYNMVVFAIRFLAIQVPLQALIESRIKYLQAIHKKHNVNILTLLTRFAFVILSAFLLGRLFGSHGILVCNTVSDALTLIAIYIYYAIKCRKARPSRCDFLNLPSSFHLNPGDVISLDVRNLSDATLVSEQIMMFCKGHRIDNKIGYYAALSFEELATNIVLHGFPISKGGHSMIDVRVVISDGSLVMRIRDNCPQYDITKNIASVAESGDPVHNIGTRIVRRIASDITYLNTFDTNNLIIRFGLGG